ncbi:MAG: 8-amino-7-oxononanoate synthase, partial [Frankiales bacterium]|nr:8-amino-7-oxononanoate synthase [Frankiales bacterium]
GRVRDRAGQIAAALGLAAGEGAVVPVLVGAADRAAAARDACLAEGVLVGCFRPPAVPPGGSCLRLTARADLSDADLRRATDVVLRSVAA